MKHVSSHLKNVSLFIAAAILSSCLPQGGVISTSTGKVSAAVLNDTGEMQPSPTPLPVPVPSPVVVVVPSPLPSPVPSPVVVAPKPSPVPSPVVVAPKPSPVPVAVAPTSYTTAAKGTVTLHPLGTTNSQYGYVEYLPQGYDPSSSKKWPLIVFFHGLGEVGNGTTDLANIENHGPLQMINSDAAYFAAIVVAPQTTVGYWNVDAAAQFFEFAAAKYNVDQSRIYLTGLSLGGGITWTLSGYNSTVTSKIAAVLPISGNGSPGTGTYDPKIQSSATLPTWAFVDYNDTTVTPTAYSDLFFSAYTTYFGGTAKIRDNYPGNGTTYTAHFNAGAKQFNWASGIDFRDSNQVPYDHQFLYTIYPNGGHDAWTKTYNNPIVWQWLFSQHR